MSTILAPQDQVFWYLKDHNVKPLTQDISTEILIIGGGMAGITAADSFRKKGLKVVLIEKNYCGAGATGKSSGFITPNAELGLYDLIKLYGKDAAQKLWECTVSGVQRIRESVESYQLLCDYQKQDTLVVATSAAGFKKSLQDEYTALQSLHYGGTLHASEELGAIMRGKGYHGGLSYGDTFGINGYLYCQGMKNVLKDKGVAVYEETAALTVGNNFVTTPEGSIKADKIVICADHAVSNLHKLTTEIYHAQTFLMISSPLTDTQIANIFPKQRYMTWDTDLVYTYYRINGNNRLMVGGASLLYTYAPQEKHNNARMIRQLVDYYHTRFPHQPVTFEYIWPGLIGITKDLLPIAGYDQQDSSLYYIAGAAGLPWAAALGTYSAAYIVDGTTTLDAYLSPYRSFPLGSTAQKLLGRPLTFAISNFMRVQSI